MNLSKLFPIQKKLDDRIEKEKGLEGQDLLNKKILALLVELGELANEWRGFKFWSHDQEPRTKDYKQIKCKWCNGSGDDGTGICPDCKSSGDVYKEYNPLLEEFVDCLHFILSIGLEIGVCPEELDAEPIFCANVTEQFSDLFYEISCLKCEERNGQLYEDYLRYDVMLEHFVGLGEMLGFTWEQIEQAYFDKNKVNHERQENGY
ncbi:dimeric dUTPase (all-alpha-NTP-PPase superfamily) [Cerasibacillus quisquiliarum]|uniref:dUTPase n=1 Tax=Cerasibacillus quisquiliarum TaxID=227865 RepID=A0A511UWI1_9BACI|nr:dUTP diphosphatase [Cerasibacillus quisquiliarum]MBB5144858.1 dimeric dUTPase (all-alpha-NTP-PPase superfamily) [Cerasibacillus quisquiliarum]GEN30251.1 hypothetical protein CQU01_04890 [Cerasibacillus quisquiliarum]